MTDEEAIERSRLCTYDDLVRWWEKESAEQRAKHLGETADSLRREGFSEAEIPALLVELAEFLDRNRAEGFERLRALRGSVLDPPMVQ